jgi:hypothetical protein
VIRLCPDARTFLLPSWSPCSTFGEISPRGRWSAEFVESLPTEGNPAESPVVETDSESSHVRVQSGTESSRSLFWWLTEGIHCLVLCGELPGIYRGEPLWDVERRGEGSATWSSEMKFRIENNTPEIEGFQPHNQVRDLPLPSYHDGHFYTANELKPNAASVLSRKATAPDV